MKIKGEREKRMLTVIMLYCQMNTHRRYYWRNLDPYLKHRKQTCCQYDRVSSRIVYNIIPTIDSEPRARLDATYYIGEGREGGKEGGYRCSTQLINSPRGIYKLTDDEVYPDRNMKNAFTRISRESAMHFYLVIAIFLYYFVN